MRDVSQTFVEAEGRLLLQLRDFIPSIVYPGHWGFFAGQWEAGESAREAMLRELNEELVWQPDNLESLGSVVVERTHRMHLHYCKLNVPLTELTLQEGQELGAFSKEEIHTGKLYSQKWGKPFPVSPISLEVFLQIYRISIDA